VSAVAAIDEFTELSIGHSIIARAIMIGLDRAVREMKDLIWKARIKHSGEHHKL
jgi:pyridoxine 5-phosphate synthase